MTVPEFAWAIYQIGRTLHGSVTSWGRTDAHAKDVGGFAGDPHTWWLGADMVYDVRPPLADVRMAASARGLRVLRELSKPHDHFQPADFPAGPTTTYDGMPRP